MNGALPSDVLTASESGRESATEAQHMTCLQGKAGVEFKTYQMGHNACPQEIQDLAAFLKKVIP